MFLRNAISIVPVSFENEQAGELFAHTIPRRIGSAGREIYNFAVVQQQSSREMMLDIRTFAAAAVAKNDLEVSTPVHGAHF